MSQSHFIDEYLEQLWYMKEEKQTSVDVLKLNLADKFDLKVLSDLNVKGLAKISPDNKKINLTENGESQARQLVRSHRLAERLLHDVLGGDFEKGACEFEHIVSPELVNSICTVLGHPKECPHGLVIPEGECCKRSDKTALSCIIPLTQLKLGTSARIAYVKCQNDQQIHRLEGLCVRPGVNIKLHQNYPTFVIECEGAHIALDNNVADNISVWRDQQTEDKKNEIQNSSPGIKKESGGLKKFFKRFKD
ncbi:MAG: FeoA domain-containing protein [Candidatus Omnitrophica bacterium]|nr:FeoA domain-containing protein [Candidatus Omnitrophota bacterium]